MLSRILKRLAIFTGCTVLSLTALVVWSQSTMTPEEKAAQAERIAQARAEAKAAAQQKTEATLSEVRSRCFADPSWSDCNLVMSDKALKQLRQMAEN